MVWAFLLGAATACAGVVLDRYMECGTANARITELEAEIQRWRARYERLQPQRDVKTGRYFKEVGPVL